MDIPAPRLCQLSRTDINQKFGFHLTGQKNKPGQCYISSVETDSPAHYAGLQVGDRVVEVDGAGVGLENHQQVVTRIAAAGDTLSMLVTDSTCEEYHSSRGIVITSALPHVVEIRNSNVGDDLHKTILTVNCDKKEKIVDEQVNQTKEVKDANNNESALFHLNIPILSEKVESVDLMGKDTKEKTESSEEADILVNLAKTAKEMREIIMQRKKKDPRREKRKDLKRRVEMVEEL